jgi:hypothetical protein
MGIQPQAGITYSLPDAAQGLVDIAASRLQDTRELREEVAGLKASLKLEREARTKTAKDLEASRTVARQERAAREAGESELNICRLALQHQKRMGWLVLGVSAATYLLTGLGLGGLFGGQGR